MGILEVHSLVYLISMIANSQMLGYCSAYSLVNR